MKGSGAGGGGGGGMLYQETQNICIKKNKVKILILPKLILRKKK